MQIKRKTWISVMLIFVMALLLFGCDTESKSELEEEILKIEIVDNAASSVSYYEVQLVNNDSNTNATYKLNGNLTEFSTSVPLGKTTVNVTSYQEDDVVIANSTGEVDVVAGKENTIRIELGPKIYYGNLHLTIATYPASNLKASLYKLGSKGEEFLKVLDLNKTDSTYKADVELEVGRYKLVIIDADTEKKLRSQEFEITSKEDVDIAVALDEFGNIDLNIADKIESSPTVILTGKSIYKNNEAYSIEAEITGFVDPTYTWYMDNKLIEGADSAVLEGVIPDSSEINPEVMHYFRCVVSEGEVTWSGTLKFNVDYILIPEGLDGITIQLWHAQMKGNGAAMDKVIENFNKTNPYGIMVVGSCQGGYNDTHKKAIAALDAGMPPHITQAYNNNILQYLPSGKLMDLTGYLQDGVGISEAELSTVIPSVIAENSSFPDGKIYATSLVKSTEVLFYNKTFCDEYDIKVPTTFDELTESAKKASEILGKPAFAIDSADNWGIYGPENFGAEYTDVQGNVLLFDDNNMSKTRSFYEWWKNGVDNGWFRLPGEERYCTEPFSRGDIIFFIGSSSGTDYIKPDGFECEVAQNPVGVNPKVIQQGASFCGFSTGDYYVDLATSIVLEYLYSVEAGAIFAAKTSYIPANQASFEHPLYKEMLAKGGLGAAAKEVAVSYPDEWMAYDLKFKNSYQIRKILATPIKGIVLTDATIDELIAETIAELDKLK